jgi:hypothetical protein
MCQGLHPCNRTFLGKKFFGINSSMADHELIGLNEYFNNDVFVGEQVEVGSETIALCLNHKIINGWSTKNIMFSL